MADYKAERQPPTRPLPEIEAELVARLTPDFLATLRECGRVYGWSGDYIEVFGFIDGMHERAGIYDLLPGEMEPYRD